MSERMRPAAVQIGAGLFGTLLLAPLWITLGAWLAWAGEPAAAAALGPLGSLLGAVVCAARPLRRWVQLLLALALGAGGVAFCSAVLGASPLAALPAGAALLYGFLQGVTVAERIGDTRWQWFGLLLYFAAAILYSQVELFAPAVPLLTWSGAASLAIALFVANGVFLTAASYSNRRGAVPGALRRHNRLLLGGVLALIALLTALFGNAFGKLLYAILRGLLSLLPRGEEGEEAPEEPAGPNLERPPLPPPEPGGERAMILDFIAYALGTLIMLGLLFLAARWLYRNGGERFRSLVERILSFLRRQRAPDAEEAGYTDEETGVFSWDTVGRRFRDTWLGRLFARGRETKWEDLRTNRERIRWLYRRWLTGAAESGYEVRRALTPRETAADVLAWQAERGKGRGLFGRGAAGESSAAGAAGSGGAGAETLAELYDRVRYGDADVSDGDVRRARAAAGLKPDGDR